MNIRSRRAITEHSILGSNTNLLASPMISIIGLSGWLSSDHGQWCIKHDLIEIFIYKRRDLMSFLVVLRENMDMLLELEHTLTYNVQYVPLNDLCINKIGMNPLEPMVIVAANRISDYVNIFPSQGC